MTNTTHLKWGLQDDKQLELLISQQCDKTREGNTFYYYLDD